MQHYAPPAPTSTRPLWLVVLAAGMIVGVSMGTRQVMGLYLPPISEALKVGTEPFSTSMAVANLVWGVCAVFAGMIADRFGAGRVVVAGTVATVAGFYAMYAAQSPFDLMVSGVLLGIGVSGTGITALVGAAGRAAPPDKRTVAIASLGMASGIGQFVAYPYTHLLMEVTGWQISLLLLAATMVAVLPFALPLSGKPTATDLVDDQSLLGAFREALTHRSYILLVIGFFVCGFHVAFYSIHLPKFVRDAGLEPWVGVWALAAVGVANLLGTFIAGQSSRWVEKRLGLSLIYFGRCFVFVGLLFLPINATTVIVLSAILGLLWLSTVPLTSGLVATFFGTRWMSMLFGVVFLSHQLGSFSGLYLAGVLYDATKSYDMMWWLSIALGLFAAAVHLPIREHPVPRLAATGAA